MKDQLDHLLLKGDLLTETVHHLLCNLEELSGWVLRSLCLRGTGTQDCGTQPR